MSLDELQSLTNSLNEERDVYIAMAEMATDGYWDWHITSDYEYMSPKFWEILGYDPATKKHHPSEWRKVIHPDDGKIAAGKLFEDHVKSKGQIPYHMKVRYKHGSDKWVWVLCRGQVIKWDGDKPIRMVGTHTFLGDCKPGEEK